MSAQYQERDLWLTVRPIIQVCPPHPRNVGFLLSEVRTCQHLRGSREEVGNDQKVLIMLMFAPGYPYMDDLLQKDHCRHHPPVILPPGLSKNPSPLQWETWKELLRDHPDRQYTSYIISDFKEGFRIGYSYNKAK